MIKIIFITIILLFNSLPSYGSVDSKGIICKCLDCKLNHLDPSSYLANKKPTEIGFHFKINKVAIYYISKIGDNIKVSENLQATLRKKKRFYIDQNEIKWTYKDSINIYAYLLDRKNLILSKMNITKTKTLNRRNCKAYPEIEFFKNMNLLSEKYQTYYDKKTNKNKI
tara:strand:- start:61 stop:564 length:504 start_codon:yes stop_codon:yes gene_type:complete